MLIWFCFQNDYLDAFGDSLNRPIGTDIKMSRITWLSINAFHKYNAAQKTLFLKHYGNSSEQPVAIIIDLYKELDLPKLYYKVENKYQSELQEEINDLPNDIIPQEIFHWYITNLKQGLINFS